MNVDTSGATTVPSHPFPALCQKKEWWDSTEKFPVFGFLKWQLSSGSVQAGGKAWTKAVSHPREVCAIRYSTVVAPLLTRIITNTKNVLNKQPQRKMFQHLLWKYDLKWISTHDHRLPLFFRKELHWRGKNHENNNLLWASNKTPLILLKLKPKNLTVWCCLNNLIWKNQANFCHSEIFLNLWPPAQFTAFQWVVSSSGS